ncbi:MAG: hypothetical protein GY777_25125, partial [Candidatus Brocadiaceae bacterium]|nr:hypothetical protein [Candidatus Brocadiaceae bacterium]
MSLKTKIVFLLFMMLVVAVCNLIVIYNFFTHHEGGAHVIDVAGRQRMFVQKISKLAFAVANGSESERHSLEETVELYNTSLFFLRDGGHIKGGLIQAAPHD